jgi:hypothetical protein
VYWLSYILRFLCGSLQDVANCSLALEGLVKNVDWPAAHKMETDKDVSFEMIGDNVTTTLDQVLCTAR